MTVADIPVNVDNFVRAETDRMFRDLSLRAGGINRFHHVRTPTPLDAQTVIRMNRDTLYSIAIMDIASGGTVTIPNASGRYISVMVVNEDHYINQVFHEAGEYELTVDQFDTTFVAVAARILVDPNDEADVAKVNSLQDRLAVSALSARPFEMPDYDTATMDATRTALLDLAAGISGFDHTFGRKSHVDPVRHLLGTAGGWGGLPETEAYYVNVDPGLPVSRRQVTVGAVPVDGFWSISLYNRKGFFEPGETGAASVNSVTADYDSDGSVTVTFGGTPDDPNNLAIMDGWNYIVRLYQPRPAVLDGTWTFPAVKG